MKNWYRLLAGRPTATVGVDIGAREIKVAKVKKSGTVPEVVAVGRFPTPPDAIANGIDGERLAPALKKAVESTGAKVEDVTAAAGGDKVIIRNIRLPVMPEKEVESAVRWEAEKHIPVPLGELVLRHATLGEVTADGVRQLQVLLAAIPLKTAYEYYNLFQQAGLKLVAIDLQTFALWRVFAGSQKPPPSGTVAVIDIGSAVSQFVVLRDGKIELTRTMTVGGDTVTEAFARAYGVDFAEAERIKTEEGGIAIAAGEVAAAVEPAALKINAALGEGLSEIVRGIRQSLSWYSSQNREQPVERIILCGGGAKLKGLTAFLTEELGLPVDLGHPGIRMHTANPEEEYDPSLAVAIGLALREVVD